MSSRVAITGASGYIGSKLVRHLDNEDSVEHILAIDVVQPSTPFGTKTVFVRHDVAQPFPDLLAKHGVDTVVHTAYLLRPSHNRDFAHRVNVDGTRHLLDACEAAGSRKLIYPGSTSVYGAHPGNPPLLTEDMPVRPVKDFHYSEDKVLAEMLINRYAAHHPDFVATILRTPPVMGANADNFIARAFSKPFLIKVGNADPPMQFIHEDDFLDMLVHSILNDAPGVYNVGGDGTIRWTEMCTMLGRRAVMMPPTLLYPLTDIAWQLRLNRDSPACGLHFIRYPWVADTDKIKRELGIEFHYTSEDAWRAFAASASKP